MEIAHHRDIDRHAPLQRYHARRRCERQRRPVGLRTDTAARPRCCKAHTWSTRAKKPSQPWRCGATTKRIAVTERGCAWPPEFRELHGRQAGDDVVVLGAEQRARRVDQARAGGAQVARGGEDRALARGEVGDVGLAQAPARLRVAPERAGAASTARRRTRRRPCRGAGRARAASGRHPLRAALRRRCAPRRSRGLRSRSRARWRPWRGGRGAAAPRASWGRRRSRRCGRGCEGARRSRASCRRPRRSSRSTSGLARSPTHATARSASSWLPSSWASIAPRLKAARPNRFVRVSTTRAVSLHAPACVAMPSASSASASASRSPTRRFARTVIGARWLSARASASACSPQSATNRAREPVGQGRRERDARGDVALGGDRVVDAGDRAPVELGRDARGALGREQPLEHEQREQALEVARRGLGLCGRARSRGRCGAGCARGRTRPRRRTGARASRPRSRGGRPGRGGR